MATPQQSAAKWASRLKGAGQEIRQGVQNTDKNPMELAANAQDRYLARVTQSVNDGTYARRLRAVPVSKWKENTIEIGIPRIAAGADKAVGDMEQFFAELEAHQAPLIREVDSLPNTTLEDSINRMTTFVRGMAEFRRT